MFRITAAAAALLLAATIDGRPPAASPSQDPLTRARALHKRFPIVEGPTPWGISTNCSGAE